MLYAIAVAAAASKILPLPSACAFWLAELNTFSNTRGTDRMYVGWNAARSGSSVLTSGTWPSRCWANTHPTSMTRAKMCASGRNSSVDPSRWWNSAASARVTFSTSNRKFPWVISQPLGRPVVPDV
jgi:hypothetical protein